MKKKTFFLKNIWSYKKKAVSLPRFCMLTYIVSMKTT